MPLFPPQDYRKTEFTHRRGTAASRPAAADVLPGTLYFSTDTLVLERSTGSAWETYSGVGGSIVSKSGVTGFPYFIEPEEKEENIYVPFNRSSVLPIRLTDEISGVLTVPNGGTGNTSLTLNRIPIGNGVNPFLSYSNLTYDGTKLSFGGQLQFPATQAASTDANCLDDYEEGTWTPVITFGGGSTGITYTNQVGYYVKIGRFVALTGLITLSNKGSSTGNCIITGLPFSVGIVGADYSSNKVSYDNFTAGVQEVGLQSIPGSATINVVKSAAGTNTILTDVDFTNTVSLVPYFCYQVA